MVTQSPDVDAIHTALRDVTGPLEERFMGVLFDTREQAGTRRMGHESLADRLLAETLQQVVNDALAPWVDIEWEIQHVEESALRSRRVAGGEEREFAYPIVRGHGYPLPGHGNTTRALDPIKARYKLWAEVPPEVKGRISRNAAMLLSLNYPDSDSSMVSVLKLHSGEILSAVRRRPNEHSDGFRGGKELVPLRPEEYRIDPYKAIRIINPNYLGSLANERHLGEFRHRIRSYCQMFGPQGFDVSFDGAEWNTACDIGAAIIVRHQAVGYVDVRSLTPNINPERDARLIISDIRVPAHIIETVNYHVGTTEEAPLDRFHDMSNLSEPLDAMFLAPDLINGALGFDFREAVLDGRVAYLRKFYEFEGVPGILNRYN